MTERKTQSCHHCAKEYPKYTDMYVWNNFYGPMVNGVKAIDCDDEFCSIYCAKLYMRRHSQTASAKCAPAPTLLVPTFGYYTSIAAIAVVAALALGWFYG